MKKLMSLLIALLTIGLIISTMSCNDKGEIIDYIHYHEIRYVNAPGVSPVQLDFYDNNEMKVSVLINNKDTTFVATEDNDYEWMMPASHDSVVVKFGNMPSKTYSEQPYVQGVRNPCLREYYVKENISDTRSKYTFTFTKDMLE